MSVYPEGMSVVQKAKEKIKYGSLQWTWEIEILKIDGAELYYGSAICEGKGIYLPVFKIEEGEPMKMVLNYCKNKMIDYEQKKQAQI